MKKIDYTIPLILLTIILAIKSIAASYRASELVAKGFISQASITADFLFFGSNIILISVVLLVIKNWIKNPFLIKVMDYATVVSIIIGVIMIFLVSFL